MATESKVKGVAAALAETKKRNQSAKKPSPPAKKRAKKAPAPGKTATKPKAPKTPKVSKVSKAPRTTTEKPPTGQGAPPIELSLDRLNSKEARVLEVLNGEGGKDRPVFRIDALAALCFKGQEKKQGNSWVRNSLRRLIQGGLAEKVDRGHYRVSGTGRSRMAAAA